MVSTVKFRKSLMRLLGDVVDDMRFVLPPLLTYTFQSDTQFACRRRCKHNPSDRKNKRANLLQKTFLQGKICKLQLQPRRCRSQHYRARSHQTNCACWRRYRRSRCSCREDTTHTLNASWHRFLYQKCTFQLGRWSMLGKRDWRHRFQLRKFHT